MEKFYAIKTIHINEQQHFECDTDAITESFDLALDWVETNRGDLSEGGYNQYLVVGWVEMNSLYPFINERKWYKWDKKLNKYIECSRPEFLEMYYLNL